MVMMMLNKVTRPSFDVLGKEDSSSRALGDRSSHTYLLFITFFGNYHIVYLLSCENITDAFTSVVRVYHLVIYQPSAYWPLDRVSLPIKAQISSPPRYDLKKSKRSERRRNDRSGVCTAVNRTKAETTPS